MSEKLQGQIKGYFGEKYLNDKEIPSHISENLSKNLREYQIECLKYYLANFEDSKFSKTHLMFNMATGSGKTLIMAALMLDCYKRGYRDFVFFAPFEFTATIPQQNNVLEKYKDKIVYEYALKQFHNDGFSKKIYLLKYNGLEIEERFLGSVILNIYRMLLAREQGIFLKPVILYKSERERQSLENEAKFKAFIESLDSKQVEEFIQSYARLSKSEDDENVLFFEAREFFKSQNITSEAICMMIKEFFDESSILNVNDTKAEEQRQILLNSLEAKDNEIRVIFAIDKLNEGWDVLNLFDIVRLNKGAIKDTTKEAQLIGRGARYFPFKMQDDENEYKRKFDTQKTPLKALEILSYHAASENEFISRLNSELINMELKQPKQKNIILRVKEQITQSDFYKEAYFATNTRYKVSSQNSLFSDEVVRKIKSKVDSMQIPLFNAKGVEQENLIKDDFTTKTEKPEKEMKASDLPIGIILKAMNVLHKTYNFRVLSKNFDMESKNDFIAKYLNFAIKLHPRQTLDDTKTDNKAEIAKTKLKIAIYVLEKLGENLNRYLDSYKVGSWKAQELKIIGDKEIMRDGNAEINEYGGYEWFYFDKFVGTTLEKEFLDFIESQKELIDKHFEKWLIIRNERFSELAIYDDREFLANGEENKHYADRFEPDFYFLGKRKEDSRIIMQCVIEPKGDKWYSDDKWKEDFLESLLDKKPIDYKNISVKLQGLPFYKEKDNERFKEAFRDFMGCENLR